MRRNARRSEGRGIAGERGVSLRRALGMALALAGAALAVAALLGAEPTTAVAAPSAVSVPSVSPTPCLHDCGTPTPHPTFNTEPPTVAPTPTPTPPPPTAAATKRPTPYAEQIDPQQSLPTIAPISVNAGITPHPSGGGSQLPEFALLGIVVFAVLAGTSFFLFFRVR